MKKMKKPGTWFGLISLGWLIAWWYYTRASREIHPAHPDVARVNARRLYFDDLLRSCHRK